MTDGDTSELKQAEVLAYMERTGASPIEAARHYFPGVSPAQHRTIAGKFSKWCKRNEKRTGRAPRPAPATPMGQPLASVATPPLMDDPRQDLAELPLLDKLLRLEAQAWTDLELARRARDHRGIALHRGQIAELGTQIETVRRQQGGTTKLDPIPAVVAKTVTEESAAIRALVEAIEAVQELAQQPQGEQPREE